MAEVRYEVAGGVARLTFDNRPRRNAMTLAMWRALGEAVEAAAADPAVRVLLLAGAGDEAFVSGADISEFDRVRADPAGVAEYDRVVAWAERSLSDCPKPVVCRIRGLCYGGGLGIALGCDLRYATREARFRMPAGRLGLGYRFEGVQRFVQVIGAPHASELFFTARVVDGAEAERIGLVQRAYAADALDDAVEATVAAIAENAPLTLRAAKLALRDALADPAARDAAAVDAAVRTCFESADYEEGRRAFREKRSPRFEGR